ncbi:hypothetical protein CMMCAS08_00895 [Clavibacter michiganensis subsp. michiganensis]|nr:hypothetical protein CMMCAS08_00895 [Clavibacter michiganensis subsp. michiganensis]
MSTDAVSERGGDASRSRAIGRRTNAALLETVPGCG